MAPNTAATSSRQNHPQRRPRPGQSGDRQASRTAEGSNDARISRVRVRIGSPTSLLAIIPGLLGFDPGHSVVVIGTDPRTDGVRVTLRYDMPGPCDPREAAALAKHAISLLAAQDVTAAAAVAYGTDAEVSPVAAALRECATERGIAVTELLRVEGGRYWSFVCTDPGCCPPEGTQFDVTDHPAARALADAGDRVLASRDELADTVAAARGQAGAVMRRATRESLAQVTRCVARLDREGTRVSARRLTAVLGEVAVRDAIRRYRDGEPVPAEHAAWLTVALGQVRVRDDAWARMDPEHQRAHLRLWTDLTRLARRGYVAAPASLLAFTAWQSGDGALANVALDRALADNPRYSMALLLREALNAGAPPSMARLPMTPEEVAAAYDAADATEQAERYAEEAAVRAGEVG